MFLGFFEIFLLLLIITVLFGPKIYAKIQKYHQLQISRNKRLQKVAAQRKAEALARQQIRNAKIKIAAVSVLGASVVFGCVYLAFWPVSVAVNAYQTVEGDTSGTAIDADLYSMADTTVAYESIAVAGYQNITQIRFYDEWLYAATEGGNIIRIRENGTGLTEIVSTGGEILSFDFDAVGNIIFTDACYDAAGGALLMASFDGFAVTVVPLVSSASGQALSYPTGVVVAADGMVYFLNATEVSLQEEGGFLQGLRTAQIAHTQNGALYAYDSLAGTCEVMVSGLCFGAGLALSAEQDVLYVSQLTDQSVWSVAVTARGVSVGGAQTAAVCTGLGGYPAGLSVAEDGMLYVAVLSPTMDWFESLCSTPAWREVLLRLPQGTRDILLQYQGEGLILALDAEGIYQASYALEGKNSLNLLTSVCEVGDRLYVVQGDGVSSIGYFVLS